MPKLKLRKISPKKIKEKTESTIHQKVRKVKKTLTTEEEEQINEIFDRYVKQTQNVKIVEDALELLNSELNNYIRRNKTKEIRLKTYSFSLTYSTWSEAQFMQILHTPNGFTHAEILELKKYKKGKGIDQAWKKMLNMGFKRAGSNLTKSDLPNQKLYILSLVENYIIAPAKIRNKIAHGEWMYPYNGAQTKLNNEMKPQLDALCPVEIYKNYRVHLLLAEIIRELIQSPKNGFHQKYWTTYSKIYDKVMTMQNWNFQSKKDLLTKKPIKK